MKKQFTTALTIALVLTSCASTHPGKMGTLLSEDVPKEIKVSAGVEDDFSDDHYQFVTFTGGLPQAGVAGQAGGDSSRPGRRENVAQLPATTREIKLG